MDGSLYLCGIKPPPPLRSVRVDRVQGSKSLQSSLATVFLSLALGPELSSKPVSEGPGFSCSQMEIEKPEMLYRKGFLFDRRGLHMFSTQKAGSA